MHICITRLLRWEGTCGCWCFLQFCGSCRLFGLLCCSAFHSWSGFAGPSDEQHLGCLNIGAALSIEIKTLGSLAGPELFFSHRIAARFPPSELPGVHHPGTCNSAPFPISMAKACSFPCICISAPCPEVADLVRIISFLYLRYTDLAHPLPPRMLHISPARILHVLIGRLHRGRLRRGLSLPSSPSPSLPAAAQDLFDYCYRTVFLGLVSLPLGPPSLPCWLSIPCRLSISFSSGVVHWRVASFSSPSFGSGVMASICWPWWAGL